MISTDQVRNTVFEFFPFNGILRARCRLVINVKRRNNDDFQCTFRQLAQHPVQMPDSRKIKRFDEFRCGLNRRFHGFFLLRCL